MKKPVITFFLAMIPSIATIILLIELYRSWKNCKYSNNINFKYSYFVIFSAFHSKIKIKRIQKVYLDCSHNNKRVGCGSFTSTRILT